MIVITYDWIQGVCGSSNQGGTHRGRDKMAVIWQMTFPTHFLGVKQLTHSKCECNHTANGNAHYNFEHNQHVLSIRMIMISVAINVNRAL